MMMHEKDESPLFHRLSPPMPPAALRSRALAAARAAAHESNTVSRTWSIATMARLQPGWALALAVLLVAHILFGFFQDNRRFTRMTLPRDREVAEQPDLLQLTHFTSTNGGS